MIFDTLFNNSKKDSFAIKFRKQRYSFFLSWLENIDSPVTILDVGGTENYWKMMGVDEEFNTHISIVNTISTSMVNEKISHIIGNGCNLCLSNNSFDIVFSNSVIEHVGDLTSQNEMAQEVIRVGKNIFIQTPNKNSFLEPHFLFPFFQFLPKNWQIWLVKNFKMGLFKKQNTPDEARKLVESIRLLTKMEFLQLFQGAKCFTEKVFGMSKSYIAYTEKFAKDGV